MYEIDFATCTAIDVIMRSIACHPTKLYERAQENAKIHSDARASMIDPKARDIAGQMAMDCRCVAIMVEYGSPFSADTPFGVLMQAFSAAVRLQLIAFDTAQDILARSV